ncbi:MAG: hypothetical protein CO095_11595, partial [Armatimonadetes bacterium CG_4_9_14_3_um_filter_58_7]
MWDGGHVTVGRGVGGELRRTKIVCTLGPASESPETIEA